MPQELTRALLLRAWKEVRGSIMRYSYRDALDHVEYDIEPEKWISRLIATVRDGTYRPHPATIGYLTKSTSGFRRQMSYPDLPDLTLYYALSLHLYRRSKRFEAPTAFFDQKSEAMLHKEVEREAQTEEKFAETGWAALFEDATDYATASRRRFRTWLRYNQYRKRLAFRKVHKFIVITDISNFFDSIIHSHLNDCLNRFANSPHLVRLIQLLLLNLKTHPEARPADQVGIPVDESDASRMLAHMLLFDHDQRMITAFGEDAYVRWMDDQNIGVSTYSDGVRAVQSLQESLRRIHLTPNSAKTKILSLADAKAYFHFASNEQLDMLERLPRRTKEDVRNFNRSLSAVWKSAQTFKNIGQWDKILMRMYRAAALTGSRRFKRRVRRDIVNHPGLCERALQYHRISSSAVEHIKLITSLLADDRLFGDDLVQMCLESLLTTEASGHDAVELRRLASELLSSRHPRSRHKICLSIAPLILFRFGDKRSLTSLKKHLHMHWESMPPIYRRSCAAVYVAMGGKAKLTEVTKLVAEKRAIDMSVFCYTLDAILSRSDVHKRMKERMQLRNAFASGVKTFDTRKTLQLRLISLNRNMQVQQWVNNKLKSFAPQVSEFERNWWKRLGF
jgi:Reverse transcriptase (RNA-dependent DNA polymerase)